MIAIFNILFGAVLTGTGVWLVKEVVKLVPAGLDLLEAKLGEVNATAIEKTAKKIWLKIEEDSKIQNFGASKVSVFENMMRSRYPDLPSAEVNLLNKSITAEFKKDAELVKAQLNIASNPAIIVPAIQPVIESAPVEEVPEVTPETAPVDIPVEDVVKSVVGDVESVVVPTDDVPVGEIPAESSQVDTVPSERVLTSVPEIKYFDINGHELVLKQA